MSTTTKNGIAIAPEHFNFPKEEEKVLEYWKKIDAFKTSHKLSEGRPAYSFYDGPPFATGLPHYGHILAGTIKDVVTRYAYQTGHHVERRFGWDCHGLPVEYEIDQQLGIKMREDVLKMGIDKYNSKCREIVMRYSKEWRNVIERVGRWIDFDNDYKTLDTPFMESEWWGFKQLFEKGLVYRGYKVMPYSTACATVLSNFEANQNYQDVVDPAIILRFPMVDDPSTNFIAWTTTPWTLPSNLALCVHPEFEYVAILDKSTSQKYILLESRISAFYKSTEEYEIVQRGIKGKDLVGKRYVPLFDYFNGKDSATFWQVIADTYVTNDSGTGIVHCAPGFGEDDYRVCIANGIIAKGKTIPCPVDANGRFTEEVTDYKGVYVKEADKPIMKRLKEAGRLISQGTITHSYPFCWRSETPLIYRAVPSWFVAVETFKEQLVSNNKLTYWVPQFVQEKRFHNWLVDARDWAISRSRFWGTPIPLWVSDDGEEIVCVGSVQELEEMTGAKDVKDLHRDFIDHLTIPSKQGKGMLHRVDEVFDCWFESGSMPWAQVHYPFENQEKFLKTFPADFIAEGLDQTRGWFYTLMVLSTALFNKPSFQNLVVNGLVLAEDGRKMSKRLKNYPDPLEVVRTHGADALRLYLINSPVVRAERLKFKLAGVKDVVKDLFLPWFNAYRFLTQNLYQWEQDSGKTFSFSLELAMKTTNVMDQWVMASLQSLVQFVRAEMKAYRLYTVIPRLVKFIEDLTNWYVRCNRRRLKGEEEDVEIGLQTLFYVILTTCHLMAPFTPFLTEHMYQNLKKALPAKDQVDSIHYTFIPEPVTSLFDAVVERRVEAMQSVIVLGRQARDKAKIAVKQPLRTMLVVHPSTQFLDDVKSLESYIIGELNVKTLTLSNDESKVKISVVPKPDILGPVLGKKFKPLLNIVSTWNASQVASFKTTGSAVIALDGENYTLNADDCTFPRQYTPPADDKNQYVDVCEGEVLCLLDVFQDESLLIEGMKRDFTTRVQKMRKQASLTPADKITVYFKAVADKKAKGLTYASVLAQATASLQEVLKSEVHTTETEIKDSVCHVHEDFDNEGLDIWIVRA